MKKETDSSYRALGLLASIPVPKGASSSRSQRVALPAIDAMDVDEEEEEVVEKSQPRKAQFGRIIRDEQGNVIDIILEDEPVEDEEEEGVARKPLNKDEESVPAVPAKTAVVKRKRPSSSAL